MSRRKCARQLPGVPGELNLGTINDFFSESLRLQYQWALRLANTYYGTPATRNYWDGCSTGGRQGLVLATQYGDDFDGFLIGAPHTNHSRTSGAGTWRTWQGKELTGGTLTDGKTNATVDRMISQCDAQDGVVDGLLSDPRTCHAPAAINLCGAPGAAAAPNCLNDLEAQAIDKAMEGAHNDLGKKVWVSYGRGAKASSLTSEQAFLRRHRRSGTGCPPSSTRNPPSSHKRRPAAITPPPGP